VHEPHSGGPIRRQPDSRCFDLRVCGDDEVGTDNDASKLDAGARRFGELLVADGFSEDGACDQVGGADPAGAEPFAVHAGDEGLDVLAADDADRLPAASLLLAVFAVVMLYLAIASLRTDLVTAAILRLAFAGLVLLSIGAGASIGNVTKSGIVRTYFAEITSMT
jgi:hypothetical protein